MDRLLCGLETEYGLQIEDRGVHDQVEDATAFVRTLADRGLFHKWDYTLESPRADLRGFRLDKLAFDPVDARFDEGRSHAAPDEVRSDVVLKNGARFYNDHGHPEYSTPEAWSFREAAIADKAGELILLDAKQAFERATGRSVSVFKNNTDFHGASYGTHESYQAPRTLGFDRLFRAVTPMLIARQVLTAAGKVGSESGERCSFQMSQRADFFSEAANAETLFRRPVFNTRDEPHADPARWIRLHVISGDANMLVQCTARKLGLVRLAIMLEEAGEAPLWRIQDPPRAFKEVSRAIDSEGRIDLEGGSWTTPREVLESYLDAAEQAFDLEAEMADLVEECRCLLHDRFDDPDRFCRSVDWAAKRKLLDEFRDAEGLDWSSPMMQSLDLEYSSIDPETSLFHALVAGGMVDPQPTPEDLSARWSECCEPNRAFARGVAVSKFPEAIRSISWSSIRFEIAGQPQEVYLDPCAMYGARIQSVESVEEFVNLLRYP